MKRCFDCAYCSTLVHIPGDICDLDEHYISDVYNESCEKFVEVEVDAE